MTEWTEEEINRIVGIKSKGGFTVDIFNSFILVSLYADNKKNNYLPEGAIKNSDFTITLDHFSGCENEDDIMDIFNEIVIDHLRVMMNF